MQGVSNIGRIDGSRKTVELVVAGETESGVRIWQSQDCLAFEGWDFAVSSAYRKSEMLSGSLEASKGFGRVPVKMHKAIRASRERCLALSASDQSLLSERVGDQ